MQQVATAKSSIIHRYRSDKLILYTCTVHIVHCTYICHIQYKLLYNIQYTVYTFVSESSDDLVVSLNLYIQFNFKC